MITPVTIYTRRTPVAVLPPLPPALHGVEPWRALMLGKYAAKVRIQAFALGVKALGGEVVALEDGHDSNLLRMTEPEHGVLVAFTSGCHNEEALARGILRACGIPLLVLDLGYMQRAKHAEDPTGYNQLGIWRTCWVPDGPLPNDRLRALNITISEPIADQRPLVALLLGQIPGDCQHGLNSTQLGAWLIEHAGIWKSRGYELHYRPHPGAMALELRGLANVKVRQCNTEPLAKALADCRVAVCYNSTAGLEAILAGIPVDCSPTAHYARVAEYGWGENTADRAAPYVAKQDLEDFLSQLAYAQWTIPELQSGRALRWLAGHAISKLAARFEAAEVKEAKP